MKLEISSVSALEDEMDETSKQKDDLLLCYTVALLELETDKAPLQSAQLVLQLVSLSLISNKVQSVVVLGTDCVDNWRLVSFVKDNSVVVQPYKHGGSAFQISRH